MLRRVLQYIKKNELLKPTDKVLVGFSGGADSVALLDVLLRGGWCCVVMHCYFNLRGLESKRDRDFVEQYIGEMTKSFANAGQSHRLSLVMKSFSTQEQAVFHHRSIEMEARELRYQSFVQVANEYNCSVIAVGHHQNDQAETVLLNLFRGTGIRGLQGMRAKTKTKYGDVPLIRPLLCTTHDYIIHYLSDIRHLPWVEDSTNMDEKIKRNKIRKILSSFSKKEIEHISQTATWMQGYVDVIEGRKTELASQIIKYESTNETLWSYRISP